MHNPVNTVDKVEATPSTDEEDFDWVEVLDTDEEESDEAEADDKDDEEGFDKVEVDDTDEEESDEAGADDKDDEEDFDKVEVDDTDEEVKSEALHQLPTFNARSSVHPAFLPPWLKNVTLPSLFTSIHATG